MQKPIELQVVSFNIRFASARDGSNNWDLRRHACQEAVKKQNPDIFGLQEAEYSQFEFFKSSFLDYSCVGAFRDDGYRGGEGSPVFYRTSSFHVVESGTFWFSDTPHVPGSRSYGNNLPRIATYAHLRQIHTGTEFVVYSTHLDHESAKSRVQSAEQLIKHAEARFGCMPRVIMGDFNCASESSAEVERFKQGGYVDSFRVVHPKEKQASTFHNWTGSVLGTKIDFIFTSKEWAVVDATIVRERVDSRFPSDHFPVTARLMLK